MALGGEPADKADLRTLCVEVGAGTELKRVEGDSFVAPESYARIVRSEVD
jgi:hypothetical protein